MTRRWYNLHATTWIVLLLAIAVAVIAIIPVNQVVEKPGVRWFCEAHHGWPLTWLVTSHREYRDISIWSITGYVMEYKILCLLVDIALAFGWIALIVAGYEIWRRRRERIQYGVIHLLMFVTAVAVACSYFATVKWRYHEEQRTIQEIGDEATIWMRWEGPNWLWKLGGEHWCEIYWRVVRIDSRAMNIDRLTTFRNLLRLGLSDVEDEDMRTVGTLRSLRGLGLLGTDITDEGLMHLTKLRRLRYLHVSDTKVSDDGIQELRELLPQCTVQTDTEVLFPIDERETPPDRFRDLRIRSGGRWLQ